jgi:hypothetical protein
MQSMVEFPDPWSEARRSDLEDALGVIVSLPGSWEEGAPPELYQWYFVSSPEFKAFEADFTEDVRQALIDAYAPVLPRQVLVQVEARPYSVGPAAQEWPKYLYLLEHAWVAAQVVATLVDVGEAARYAMGLFRRALRRLVQSGLTDCTKAWVHQEEPRRPLRLLRKGTLSPAGEPLGCV